MKLVEMEVKMSDKVKELFNEIIKNNLIDDRSEWDTEDFKLAYPDFTEDDIIEIQLLISDEYYK